MTLAAQPFVPPAPSPLDMALFGGPPPQEELRARMALTQKVQPVFQDRMARCGVAAPDPAFLTELLLPVLRFLTPRVLARQRPFVVGLAGGPGAGKTTLSAVLADLFRASIAPEPRCLSLSLDDFYFSPAERARRGFAWRTLPGSHDTERIAELLAQIDAGDAPLRVPRYDLGADAPLPDEVHAAAPDICVFDGAMMGSRLPGYAALARRLDVLIYLNVPLPLLKEWRFAREARLRARSDGQVGFPPAKMQAFWHEALEPSVKQHVRPNMAHADLVLHLNRGRRLTEAQLRRAAS